MQTFWMAVRDRRLMQVRKPSRSGASRPPASHHQHPHATAKQFGVNRVRLRGFQAGYTFQVASLLVHAAQLAPTPTRHYILVDTWGRLGRAQKTSTVDTWL